VPGAKGKHARGQRPVSLRENEGREKGSVPRSIYFGRSLGKRRRAGRKKKTLDERKKNGKEGETASIELRGGEARKSQV